MNCLRKRQYRLCHNHQDRDGPVEGFGHVEMTTRRKRRPQSMVQLVQDGQRALTVNLARPKEERSSGGGGYSNNRRSGGGGSRRY
jgi:hypothetical protein